MALTVVMHRFAPSRLVSAIDRAIAEIAACQHGVVSHAQLLALGLGEEAIQSRLRHGRLHQLHRGVYLVGHPVAPPRAAEIAAQFACEPRALVSHRSAARLWTLLACPPQPAPIDITIVGRPAHPQSGIVVHRAGVLLDRDIAHQGELRLTSPARTLLDLAAIVGLGVVETAIAQARRHRPPLITHDDLSDQIRRNRGRRGVARLRLVAEITGGPKFTHGGAERRLLELIRGSGLPEPETNVDVNGFEVDFFWPAHGLIVETDGRAYHGDELAFERDRLRDAELIAVGYTVTRVTWRQLVDTPNAVVDRIRHTLALRGPLEVARTVP